MCELRRTHLPLSFSARRVVGGSSSPFPRVSSRRSCRVAHFTFHFHTLRTKVVGDISIVTQPPRSTVDRSLFPFASSAVSPLVPAMPTTLKLYFTLPSGKQEIRRFTTDSPSVLEALIEFLTATYSRHYAPPLRFSLSYDDGEDCCSVSSEAELQEGLQLHASSGAGGVLKLLCSFDETPLGQSVSSPSASASGLSTPSSLHALVGHTVPPSPSNNGAAAALQPAPTPVVQEPPVPEETNDEPAAAESAATSAAAAGPPSPTASAHSEEGELVTDSDDEYIRIDDDAPPKSTEPVQTAAETKAESKPAAAPAPVVVEEKASTSAPRVEESAPAASPVVIEDVTAHPEPTPATSSGGMVHTGIICDGCGQSPLVGTRFRCQDCTHPGGFDLCASCAQTAAHPLSHKFEQIDAPRLCPFLAAQATAPQAASSPSASASASAPAGPAVHAGVTCDGCRLSPIVGNRYHCTTCVVPGGFDLCEQCESTGTKHPADHLMMKMRAPAADSVAPSLPRGMRHGAGARRGHCPFRPARDASVERPKAQFISDVTCADGMQVHAGETLRKTWSIKNVGPTAWPAGVRLVFAGGELSPDSENRSDAFGALVPFAGPGDVVHVSIDIVVPKEEGRFRGTFRLQTADGIRFGPRIWIDLSVPAEAAEAAKAESPAAAPAAPVAAAPAPAAASMVEAPKVAELKVAPVEVAAAPKAAALPVAQPVAVAAPVSASSVPAPAPVVASPAASESKQREEESAQLAAEFAAAHVSPAAEAPRASSFPYSNQAAILRSMGFMDKELCRYLLLNNKGDLEKVVAWLLANAQSA